MYVCLLFHFPSLSLSLSIFLPSFISFIKKQFARSLLFFYLLQISPSLRAWKSSRSPCLFGPAPQNVITASRSAFVRSPSIFLHSSFIFFSFFFSFSSSSSTYSNTSNRNRAGSLIRELFRRHRESLSFCPVSRARDIFHIPSVFPSLRQLLSREIAIRTLERSLARERIHDLDRSSGGKTRRTRVSAPFLLLLLFFPLPRCVSRLRSSFFFLFLFSECSRFVCVIRGGSSFAPGPLDPRSTEKEIDKLA